MGLRADIKESNKEVVLFRQTVSRHGDLPLDGAPRNDYRIQDRHALVDELDVMKRDKAEQTHGARSSPNALQRGRTA